MEDQTDYGDRETDRQIDSLNAYRESDSHIDGKIETNMRVPKNGKKYNHS